MKSEQEKKKELVESRDKAKELQELLGGFGKSPNASEWLEYRWSIICKIWSLKFGL